MMNEVMLTQMKNNLADMAAACKARETQLAMDGRTDESIHARIERNVYEAFSAVLHAAARQSDPETFFRARLAQIPANWVAAKETAEAHGDSEKALIESIKIKAADAIAAVLDQRPEGQA